MQNLDPPEPVSSNPRNGFFNIDPSNKAIVIGGFHHPKYPKNVIVTLYCQANKMLGLVALQTDFGVDEQYGSCMYFLWIQ